MFEGQRVVCENWERLIDTFGSLSGWVFRGHAAANWTLSSTLERRTPVGQSRRLHEFNISREFKRRAHNYLRHEQIPTTPGEWLALMQHYGAPTRLLDFTRSPYVATYFAFEESPQDGAEYSAVIAISPTWCHRALGQAAAAAGTFLGYDMADILAGVAAFRGAIPGPVAGTDDTIAGALLSGRIEQHADTHTAPIVTVFEPERLMERMAAQQGTFLWPGDVERTVMENLASMPNIEDGIRLLLVPVAEQGRVLDELRLMNITRTSLFPGLEGFAGSFRQLGVREEAHRRAVRMALLGLRAARPMPSSPVDVE